MGNNKEVEIWFTGKSLDAHITSCVCPVNPSDSSWRLKKKKTIVLVLLWCTNIKLSERSTNPSKVSFILADVGIFEVIYV